MIFSSCSESSFFPSRRNSFKRKAIVLNGSSANRSCQCSAEISVIFLVKMVSANWIAGNRLYKSPDKILALVSLVLAEIKAVKKLLHCEKPFEIFPCNVKISANCSLPWALSGVHSVINWWYSFVCSVNWVIRWLSSLDSLPLGKILSKSHVIE